jgi:hypothetical protein
MNAFISVFLLLIRSAFCRITYYPNRNVSEYKIQLTGIQDTFDIFTTHICDVIRKSRMIELKDIKFRDYPVDMYFGSYTALMYALETQMPFKTHTPQHFIKRKGAHTPLIEGGKKLWLEFGVNEGYSINVTASIRLKEFSAFDNIDIHGFDWFRGLPTYWPSSGMGKGAFDLNGKLPNVIPEVRLVAGLFNETLDAFLKNTVGSIDFVNIDNDLYEGALYILQRVLPRMHRGSIIHFHELLKWPSKGKCEAHDELRALYKVFDIFPGLHLELIAIRGQSEEPVIFRFINL